MIDRNSPQHPHYQHYQQIIQNQRLYRSVQDSFAQVSNPNVDKMTDVVVVTQLPEDHVCITVRKYENNFLPAPQKRFGHVMTASPDGTRFLIHGGSDYEEVIHSKRDLWVYDTVEEKWVQGFNTAGLRYHKCIWGKSCAYFFGGKFDCVRRSSFVIPHTNENCIVSKFPILLSSFGLVVDKYNVVWIFGGLDESSMETSVLMNCSLDQVERTYNEMQSLPVSPLQWNFVERNSNSPWPCRRAGHGIVYNEKSHSIIVMYGATSYGTISALLDDIWILDCATCTWKEVVLPLYHDHPLARKNFGIEITPDSRNIIILGGDLQSRISDECWIFNLETFRWQPVMLLGDIPPRCAKLTLLMMKPLPWKKSKNARMYIFGGMDGNHTEFGDLYKIEFDTAWGQSNIWGERKQRELLARLYQFADVEVITH